MKTIQHTILAAGLLAASSAYALVNIDFQEIGSDVLVTASGSFGVFPDPQNVSSSENQSAEIGTAFDNTVIAILSGASTVQSGLFHGGIIQSAPWSAWGSLSRSSGAVGDFGIRHDDFEFGTAVLRAPAGYTAGSPLNATWVIDSVSLTALGFTSAEIAAGSGAVTFNAWEGYTWSINGGSVIPEPSSFAVLAGLGVLGAAALRRQRRA